MGQAKRRIGHQGVPGAYSDLAATSFFAGMDYEKKAFPYFEDVVVAVMDGTIDYGVLPIENSSTGGITDVYDLIRKYHAYIVGEKIVKVEHCLLVYDDTQLEEIREVYSHPQGLSQCHAFFRSHPFLRAVPCSNTAEAARMVAERKKRCCRGWHPSCGNLWSFSPYARDPDKSKQLHPLCHYWKEKGNQP